MATKQRRPVPKSPKRPRPPSPAQAGRPARALSPPAQPAPQPPQRRMTYVEAVALYERALEALQRHDFAGATALFESVLRQYPEEKGAARTHTALPERLPAPGHTEGVHAADPGRAALCGDAGHQRWPLRSGAREPAGSSGDEDPDNDHALYMLAVAHAQRGELAEAVAHLERALALNPENRALAKSDPDLEPLRRDDAFRTALDAPTAPRADRRRSIRSRSSRYTIDN